MIILFEMIKETIKKLIPRPVKSVIKKLLGMKVDVRNSDIIPRIKEVVNRNAITVLDVGCGKLWDGNGKDEDILFSVFSAPQFKITGVDVFKECVDWRNKNGPAGTYLQMDARDIEKVPGMFDIVLSHHMLEHFPKEESEKILSALEKKAVKQIIIGTPIGFTDTEYAVHIHGNEHERHLCAWQPEEFKKRGYEVFEIKNALLAVKNIG